MAPVTVRFLKASLVYFLTAGVLGMLLFTWPDVGPRLRFMHTHFNLLGWVSMLIYGVAYHIIPRFQGRPLYSERLAYLHFWLANVGLIGMGLMAFYYGVNSTAWLAFALVQLLAAILFAINLWQTLGGSE